MSGTPITLDKQRHLRYTPNDLADMEEVLGAGWLTVVTDEKYMGIRTIRAFLWAGLKHEDRTLRDPRVGLQKAGDLINIWIKNGGSMTSLYPIIIKALKADGWLQDGGGEGLDEGEQSPS